MSAISSRSAKRSPETASRIRWAAALSKTWNAYAPKPPSGAIAPSTSVATHIPVSLISTRSNLSVAWIDIMRRGSGSSKDAVDRSVRSTISREDIGAAKCCQRCGRSRGKNVVYRSKCCAVGAAMHSRREAARTFRTSASHEQATIVGAHATFNDEQAPSLNEPYFDLSDS